MVCIHCGSKNAEKKGIEFVVANIIEEPYSEIELKYDLYCIDCGKYIIGFRNGVWL